MKIWGNVLRSHHCWSLLKIGPIALALTTTSTFAQTRPDAGRILQETRPTERPPAPTIAPIQAPPALAPTSTSTSTPAPASGPECSVQ